jgi:hypothetical protein
MNPHEFARRLIDTATHYVGLQETKENAAFGDSARAKRILRGGLLEPHTARQVEALGSWRP